MCNLPVATRVPTSFSVFESSRNAGTCATSDPGGFEDIVAKSRRVGRKVNATEKSGLYEDDQSAHRLPLLDSYLVKRHFPSQSVTV